MDITLHVRCDSDQPRQMVAAASAAGVKSVLNGWTENVHVALADDGTGGNN